MEFVGIETKQPGPQEELRTTPPPSNRQQHPECPWAPRRPTRRSKYSENESFNYSRREDGCTVSRILNFDF
jgi:hypothetical protein